VTADSLAYAWEHWDRVRQMANPAGYLFRVGQSKARWYHRPRVSFPAQEITETRDVEPDLHRALARLTKNQRTAVVLIYALDWTEEEVAELVGKSRSTVRTHLERGLARLRDALEVKVDV
jgi:RNA polymerase sigma factor (sigma-70 family)